MLLKNNNQPSKFEDFIGFIKQFVTLAIFHLGTRRVLWERGKAMGIRAFIHYSTYYGYVRFQDYFVSFNHRSSYNTN